jgi:Methyltransferase domain
MNLDPKARRAVDRAVRALGDRRARPNLGWLAELTGATADELSLVLEEAPSLLPFEEEIRRHHQEGGRPHYAQFRAPFELYAMARILRPEHVVETGVSSGVSSAHFLLALRRNRRGRLHSIDLPTPQRGPRFGVRDSPVALPPGRASGWAVPRSLRKGWDLRIGRSEEILPGLVEELPSVGLFLHDSLHTPAHLAFELSQIRPKLLPGAIVLADNTVWTGAAFPKFAKKFGAPVRRRGRSDLVGLRWP